MISQIVTKETSKEFIVVINGKFKHISKEFKADIESIKGLIDSFNKTRVVEDRNKILESIEAILTPGKKVELLSNNQFELDANGVMYLRGTNVPIPTFLAKKLMDFIKNDFPIESLVNFWKRLLLNPNAAVREQLAGFLEHNGHPITTRGYFLAYKSVQVKRKFNKETGEEIVNVEYDEETGQKINEKFTHAMSFKPFHEGKHGMSIQIGTPITMPREECDSDPTSCCSAGLHVGSMAYVGDFGSGNKVVLECLVSPTDVVSVPESYNQTKMRTCAYFPIAISNGENDSIYLEEDFDVHTKQFLEKEFKARKANFDELVKQAEKEIASNGEVIDSLY